MPEPADGPLFIGLDAMDAGLVGELAAAGRLPVLARLLDEWDHTPTINPAGLFVGGLWPSFWSGGGPGHHGSYCFRQVLPDGNETADTRPSDFDTEPFWAALDADGYRCTVFDMPLIRPISTANGRMITEWGTHDRQLPYACRPVELDALVREVAGTHPIDGGRCDTFVLEHGYAALFDALVDGIDRRTRLLRRLLSDGDDLLLAVYSESHCAGHHFWHLHDPDHDRHDADAASALGGDPLAEIYVRVDAALGEVLDAAGERPAMVLLSHGIGPHHDGNHLLDRVLVAIERSHHGPPPWPARAAATVAAHRRALVRHVRRRSPSRGSVPRSIGRLDGSRRWYQVPNNDLFGGVRLNIRGREPSGRLRPGAETDEAYAQLTEELLSLRHGDGTRAVREVLRTDELHDGPRRDWLPDLLVAWDWSVPFRELRSPTIGSVAGELAHVRTGDHRPLGLVLCRGIELRSDQPAAVTDLGTTLANASRRQRPRG